MRRRPLCRSRVSPRDPSCRAGCAARHVTRPFWYHTPFLSLAMYQSERRGERASPDPQSESFVPTPLDATSPTREARARHQHHPGPPLPSTSSKPSMTRTAPSASIHSHAAADERARERRPGTPRPSLPPSLSRPGVQEMLLTGQPHSPSPNTTERVNQMARRGSPATHARSQ